MATSTRAYHHGDLRRALLEGAERALAEGGVRALSLRGLARDIGVSHAAPSRHFAGKQELLDALAQEGFERLGREMAEALDAAGPGVTDRLTAVAVAYVRFATEHAALLEVMFAIKHAREAVHDAAERAFRAPLEVIAGGLASGEIAGEDPERTSMIVWSTFHGIASLAGAGLLDATPLDAFVADAVRQLVTGLRPV